ncbi:MAG: CcmD family protein [Armatimonadetes bacterium]|nr:CcmD family protein [Armatimonadota bacterium]
MALTPDKLFVLTVALLTWGGVFVYLLRLDKLAKSLEEEVRARELEKVGE